MQIERIEIGKLISDPANTRKHPERNLQAIVASLHRFGQQKPIVVDKANIVRAGNGTLAAARSLGWTHLDAVRTELDGSNAIAYAIADNRTAELAEWDTEALTATLEGLQFDSDELLAAAGYSADELAELLAASGVFGAEEIDAPVLADGDREPFRQMTFTVHDSQFEVIEAAIKSAKANGGGESVVNENSNGNALAMICEAFNG